MGNFDKGRKGGKSFGGKSSFGGDRGGRPSFGGDRGGRSSFGGDRGGRASFGGRREERSTETFKAVCDSCHKGCEVPFRPTNGKPVYCNDCFSKNRDFDNRPSYRSGDRDTFTPKQNRSERRDAKPVYQPTPVVGGEYDGLKKQIDAINVKLETMMRTIEKMSTQSVSPTKSTAPASQKEVSTFKKVISQMPVTVVKATKKEAKKVTLKKVAVPAKKAVVKKATPKATKKVSKTAKKK